MILFHIVITLSVLAAVSQLLNIYNQNKKMIDILENIHGELIATQKILEEDTKE